MFEREVPFLHCLIPVRAVFIETFDVLPVVFLTLFLILEFPDTQGRRDKAMPDIEFFDVFLGEMSLFLEMMDGLVDIEDAGISAVEMEPLRCR